MPDRYQFWRTKQHAVGGEKSKQAKKQNNKKNTHKKNPKAVRKMNEIKNLHL